MRCSDHEAIGSGNGVDEDRGVSLVEMVRVGSWVDG